MEFNDLQMTITAVFVLTGAALVIFFENFKKRGRGHTQTVDILKPEPVRGANPAISSPTSTDYKPIKRASAERPLAPLRPVHLQTALPPAERKTFTVQLASSSPTTPAGAPAIKTSALPPVTIDVALWERLMSRRPKQDQLAAGLSGRLPTSPASSAPAKLHGRTLQQPEFEALLASKEPFTGLAVSIGINDSDSGKWHSQDFMHSVATFITGLLKDEDFCCRTAFDEFVLVCPGEESAQTNRRLNEISERLWDYQLRGIGVCSILFSWGGLQVKDRPLAEAVAPATDRMRETKRNRNSAHAQGELV
jgi:hypothetical protein